MSDSQTDSLFNDDQRSLIPVLPLRDVVVYPHLVIPLFVGREKSKVALDLAMDAGKEILLVAQRSAELEDPQPADLYEIGTLATILQLLKMPDGTVKVLVEGGSRAQIAALHPGPHYAAEITVPSVSIDAAIAAHGADVLVMDVEGAETALLKSPAVDRLHTVIVETHPHIVGPEATDAMIADLAQRGLRAEEKIGKNILLRRAS